MKHLNRQQVANIIALAFHISGFIAIAIFKSQFFVGLTTLNLLVSAALLLYTQQHINKGLVIFFVFSYLAGFGAEYIGVNTGGLFGSYAYGNLLGIKLGNVPLIIGLQWTVTLFCIGISLTMLLNKLKASSLQQIQADEHVRKTIEKKWKLLTALSVIADGALLAVLFDWVIEPVAVKLGYWQWAHGIVPTFNYLSWAVVSLPILAAFHFLSFKKQNQFAVNLLLIQFMFFLLVNRFY